MRLCSLYLKNFRNYQEKHFQFAPGVNYIYGDNGRGKTNLVEAITLLITGRSFRTRHLQELILFGKESFYIEGCFEKNGIEEVLKMHVCEGKRSVIHNQTPLTKLSSLFGILNGTLLTPEDQLLIQGNPKLRRLFLDIQISQTNPTYLSHLTRYHKAMKQRNVLLRKKRLDTLDVWEETMAESATYLIKAREEVLRELVSFLDPALIQLDYLPSCKTALREKFASFRNRDLLLGATSIGPHKDDFSISLKNRSARSFASEGQKRYVVTYLKFAEWKRLHRAIVEKPLLCIDDLSLSFDLKNETELLTSLSTFGQVFVTSARLNSSDLQPMHLIAV